MSFALQALSIIKRVVGWMVAVLLGWMGLLAFAQLLARWLFQGSIDWADQHLRQLVLWIGLLGGVLAAAESRHLHIDFLRHLLKGLTLRLTDIATGVFAAGLSLFLAYQSVVFLSVERQAGTAIEGVLFGFTIPHWCLEVIIPFGFGLMALFHLFAPLVPKSSSPLNLDAKK